jgi:hypothetical protein
MVAIPEAERAGFEDLLGSGGLFRKTLRLNVDGAAPGGAHERLCGDPNGAVADGVVACGQSSGRR